MFTGIIKGIGMVAEKSVTTNATLKINTPLATDLALGDSMAVNGVCLTATKLGNNWFCADVMPATWRSTNLSLLKIGDSVNLEPALASGDRLGGHLVSGHVDGTAKITGIEKQQNAVLIKLKVTPELQRFMAFKGSIAINGVSLTIQAIVGADVIVSIIPHTFKETTFHLLKVGDLVNVETDQLAKYIQKSEKQGITEDFLQKHGFM